MARNSESAGGGISASAASLAAASKHHSAWRWRKQLCWRGVSGSGETSKA